MATKQKTDRNEVLVRAAKLRAILIAFFNKQTEKISAHEIGEAIASKMAVIGADVPAMIYQLAAMAKNNLISSVKEDGKVFYSKKNAVTKKTTAKAKTQVKSNDDVFEADIKMQLVKSTGAMRFIFNGIKFEVSTVDE